MLCIGSSICSLWSAFFHFCARVLVICFYATSPLYLANCTEHGIVRYSSTQHAHRRTGNTRMCRAVAMRMHVASASACALRAARDPRRVRPPPPQARPAAR